MKPTKMQEGRQESIKERIARGIGAQLEKMAVDPRGCWALGVHEPEMPPEIIAEMLENQ